MAATFVVEDGTGKSDANSYVSIADADQYNLDHNADATWIGKSDADKQKALRLATQWLDSTYNERWEGSRSNEDQALAFPRYNVIDYDGYYYDSDEIPQKLKDACVEMAIVSAGGTTLIPNLTDSGTIKRQKNKVGALEQDTEYTDGKSPTTYYRLATYLLRGLIMASSTLQRS